MTRSVHDSRSDAERARRMRRAFFEVEPSDREILVRMAQHRAVKSAPRRRLAPRFHAWSWGLAVGLLLSGSAFALAVSTGQIRFDATEGADALEESKTKAPSSAPNAPASTQTTKHVDEETATTAPEEAAPPAHEQGARSANTPTGNLKPSSKRQSTDPAPLADEQARSASWARVAHSMKEGNHEDAETELSRLAQSPEQKERDAALILRLQIALKNSRATVGQINQLRRLAKSSPSPSVRDSARRLIAREKEKVRQ